jgi:hypothetical protein
MNQSLGGIQMFSPTNNAENRSVNYEPRSLFEGYASDGPLNNLLNFQNKDSDSISNFRQNINNPAFIN